MARSDCSFTTHLFGIYFILGVASSLRQVSDGLPVMMVPINAPCQDSLIHYGLKHGDILILSPLFIY
jgi:hypothetical protein